ncbi:CAMK/CAMKL/PASK protein kinase [Coprinopsis cinerea okayama7|uniref:CAMK/CAMKL/PASK protein kinase n=1 Tax=Coprinopsis cinerea (strain Okayama-7 / 130 / ATCC MYA-4618 / FGSC 9003) TaxID=240176 RepID=A8N1H7_COPC7|nr:CAMK/CAMKL/PASK protein kinase [Coprinopsis cinerea okayama7\|eukprot:XP_001828757.2 CAMK/CAMKL/PASK protein kinase [Coprinopsis cinerea okayama7\
MLSTSSYKLAFDEYDYDSDWTIPTQPPKVYRSASVKSWGVTSIGRGFDWDEEKNSSVNLDEAAAAATSSRQPERANEAFDSHVRKHHHHHHHHSQPGKSPVPSSVSSSASLTNPKLSQYPSLMAQSHSLPQSRSASPNPLSSAASFASFRSPTSASTSPVPSSPRPRRRSSQQRVSLIAGRVSIAPIEPPPSPPPLLPQSLRRTPSSGSILSTAASTRAPSPASDNQSFIGGRSISEFEIEGEIGRGAYGLVKRAREILSDGSLGPPLIIKQVIKSRILADCWKKHPRHGTIPIEIYVMSAISNTSYILPPKRPWDPSRFSQEKSKDALQLDLVSEQSDDDWVEGKVVKGHPNICPLLDFFEDNHYYYLVLPFTSPDRRPGQTSAASDLFDLVESYPNGLPPFLVRSYLGQIADALAFLHSHGIVHRDVKDENVILGPRDKAILIDFGSSGLIKKTGWDTFSGTLDYAGPEILRGERYYGKEQDVWAFGVVAYVLLVGECPFMTATEAQEGFSSPFANASISLDERCGEGKEGEGEEPDGGGALGDAAVLVRACLAVDPAARPTFEKIMQSRFLAGKGGWGMEKPM